jgi:hypothetical protein
MGTRTTIGKRRMVVTLRPADSFQKKLLEAIQRDVLRPLRESAPRPVTRRGPRRGSKATHHWRASQAG